MGLDRLELISINGEEIIEMELLAEDNFSEVNIDGKTISISE